MSQSLTLEVALTLRKGDTLYHNVIEFVLEDGSCVPATATVLGKAKQVSGKTQFHLPIHQNYGAEIDTVVDYFGRSLWRTVPERLTQVAPARVRRQRSTPEVTPTGRVVDREAVELDKTQAQLLPVAKRVTRARP